MIESNSPVFGNGYSLKYFKALFILFIPMSILEIFIAFGSVTLRFFMSGDNESRFYAYLSVQAQLMLNWFNLLLIILASVFIFLNKKKIFSLVFLLKYPLILLGEGYIFYLKTVDFPYDPAYLTGYLGSIVSFLFFYVPHLIYLGARIRSSHDRSSE
ncbi:MAG: hypothetical protein HGB31_05135 [Erysipelotrichaceae bacterium]|nr:hypothetical protein [Erysipelotrichaceae bacterium]